MESDQDIAAQKVQGPFEVIENVGTSAPILIELPYQKVRGSQIVASVIDNFGQQQTVTTLVRFWAAVDLQIWGRIQGYDFLLKKQHTRMNTGPLVYIVPDEEAYDAISIRGRNMSGGRPGPVPGAAPPNPTAAPIPGFPLSGGFSLMVQLYIQPRGGMGLQSSQQGGKGQAIDSRRAF